MTQKKTKEQVQGKRKLFKTRKTPKAPKKAKEQMAEENYKRKTRRVHFLRWALC